MRDRLRHGWLAVHDLPEDIQEPRLSKKSPGAARGPHGVSALWPRVQHADEPGAASTSRARRAAPAPAAARDTAAARAARAVRLAAVVAPAAASAHVGRAVGVVANASGIDVLHPC